MRLGSEHFQVIGVVAPKGKVLGQSFDSFALIPFTRYEMLYGRRLTTTISVKMRDAKDVDGAMHRAEEAMRVAHHLRPGQEDNFSLETAAALVDFWKQLTAVLFSVIPAVVAIGIVVGGIVIMNIMLMSVSERTREIGIRKAVGARSRDIERQFLAEAIALATTGGVLGVLAGWGFAELVAGGVPASRAHHRLVGARRPRARRDGRRAVRRVSGAAGRAARSDHRAQGRVMHRISLDQLRENLGIALDALRVSKMRSALTILGVVIGVATVMTMATIVQGDPRPDPQHHPGRRARRPSTS